MTPITERPAEVATRTVLGHWEGDLLKGARNGSAVGTLVEQATRLVLSAKMEGTDAESLYRGFTKKLRQYLPQGADLSGYTQRELNAIAYWLNTRPRKSLNFATPLEVYAHVRHYSPVALGT